LVACERTFAADAGEGGGEEVLQVGEERERALLAYGVAVFGRMTVDLGLDLEQHGHPLQRLLGDRGTGGGVDLEQLSPAVRPACDLDEPSVAAARVGLVEAVEAGVPVGVEKAMAAFEQRPRMLALAVGRVEIADRRRRRSAPRRVRCSLVVEGRRSPAASRRACCAAASSSRSLISSSSCSIRSEERPKRARFMSASVALSFSMCSVLA